MSTHPDLELTVSECYERYYPKDELSPRTRLRYVHECRRWAKYSGDPPIGTVDNAKVAEFRQQLRQRELIRISVTNTIRPIVPPLGRRRSAADWQRFARRRPPRADLVAVRGIVDRVRRDGPIPALKEVAQMALPLVMRFLNSVPDMTFVILAEEAGITYLLCSRELQSVQELVRARWRSILDMNGPASPPPAEFARIQRLRDRCDLAVRQLVDLLIERMDVTVVTVWQVAGSNDVGEECSVWMCPDERRRTVAWCAQHVLDMQVEPTWLSRLFPSPKL